MVVTVSDEETSSLCSFTAADSTSPHNYWTQRPPSSYSLKIQNLEQLVGENYQSRRFSADGYYWRLILYPKGNEKDNGSGFISMYIEIDSAVEVFAYLTFSIYNKKLNKYFCIQDTEVKRFNALKVWGVSQMLPVEIFNDPVNGYIFEGDQCEFGVDVMLDTAITQWEVVSFNKTYFPKVSCTFNHVLMLKDHIYSSNRFSVGGKTWVLKVYPTSDVKWVSIFLHLSYYERLVADERIYTRGHIRVLNPRGSNHITEKFIYWHDESNLGCGHHKFVSMAELMGTYLDQENTLSVEVEFEVVSSTTYPPIF
ncbi:unnamed protein product [Microthlaspi erraticum]|uniref:MATH domain-containing protein n=1 Tax=Microthlaspi erraticum TaxID=1685480 RepID=A0A6D2ISX6_9BRAS|nr:unnamed protein product [Microthlaspi erraticum]CAA7057231.1 unnamed protein product [Microthlaspi erraticum]